MAASVVPLTPGLAQQRVITTLAGVSVSVDMRWNTRAGTWYFDLREQDETPIVLGERFLLGIKLCQRSTHKIFTGSQTFGPAENPTRPILFAWDLSRTGVECGYQELGTRVLLVYMTDLDVFMSGLPLPRIPT